MAVLQFDKWLVETWSNHLGHHKSALFVDAVLGKDLCLLEHDCHLCAIVLNEFAAA